VDVHLQLSCLNAAFSRNVRSKLHLRIEMNHSNLPTLLNSMSIEFQLNQLLLAT